MDHFLSCRSSFATLSSFNWMALDVFICQGAIMWLWCQSAIFAFRVETETIEKWLLFSDSLCHIFFSILTTVILILFTKLDLIHELFLHVIFLSAHLFYLSILSIFLFCLMIGKKTSSILGTASCNQITRGNMMSCTFSLHGVSNQSGSTFWMTHGQTSYAFLFLSNTLMDHMLLSRA